jgi:hypothetical protein
MLRRRSIGFSEDDAKGALCETTRLKQRVPLRLRHHPIQRRLGIETLLWPDPMMPIDVFDRSLIDHALGERQHPLRSVHWRLGTEERQDRSYEDRAPSGCASNSDYGAADKKCRLKVELCLHRRGWVYLLFASVCAGVVCSSTLALTF